MKLYVLLVIVLLHRDDGHASIFGENRPQMLQDSLHVSVWLVGAIWRRDSSRRGFEKGLEKFVIACRTASSFGLEMVEEVPDPVTLVDMFACRRC